MHLVPADSVLLKALLSDPVIATTDYEALVQGYAEISERFHSYFRSGASEQHANALFHKIRYLNLLSRSWNGSVLDLGNDKPFLMFFLRKFNPLACFETVSYEIPETPFPLHSVDIEQERFPFRAETFDAVIFTEVIEHLWRDPAFTINQINIVLRPGGSLLLTTPNPCDRHSLVCILWQANPNQRSQYFATLESGHLHLWTLNDLKEVLAANGFGVEEACTMDLYGHSTKYEIIEEFINANSPFPDLMNETIVVNACRRQRCVSPQYPTSVFPDGGPVRFVGAIESFARLNVLDAEAVE